MRKLHSFCFINLLIILSLNALLCNAQDKPEDIFDGNTLGDTIRFRIIHKMTREPISYCNISIQNKTFGTVSNENGEFVISLTGSSRSDSVQISHIGFEKLTISISDLISSGNRVIVLEEKVLMLPEMTITSNKDDWIYDFMENVIDSISVNYVQDAFSFKTTLYRMTRNDKTNYAKKSNALCYFSNGYKVSATKSPKKQHENLFLIDRDCYITYDSAAGQWVNKSYDNDEMLRKEMFYDRLGLFLRDFIGYRDNNFLNRKNLSKYSFDLETENDKEMVIRFDANKLRLGVIPFMNLKSFSGKIFIDPGSYAITKIEAYAVVDEKVMKHSFNSELVGKIEIKSYYEKDERGLYYWSGSSYMENYILNTEVINENVILDYGDLKFNHQDGILVGKSLCD